MAREIAPGIHWLQSCSANPAVAAEIDDSSGWFDPDEALHFTSGAYLLVGDRSLLFDTLPPEASDYLFEQLRAILGEDGLDYLVPSHHEAPHGGNTNAILRRYPDAELLSSRYGRGHELYYLHDSERVGEGDAIDLGGLEVAFHEPTFPDTAMHVWMSERTTRTLFCVDWLGFPHNGSNCLTFVDELDHELGPDQLVEYHGRGMVWLTLTDPTKVNAAIDDVLARHDPDVVAPTHGLVVREDATRHLETMKTVVDRLTADAAGADVVF